MKKIYFYFVIVLLTSSIVISCSKYDSEMQIDNSVVISDPNANGLPIISDLGYNTFGVFFGKKMFSQINNEVPLTIRVIGDTLSFYFKGSYQDSGVATLKFSFLNQNVSSYLDIEKLKGMEFNLADTDNKVVFYEKYNNITEYDIKNGFFKVSSVKKLYIDNKYQRTIISGIFQFQTISDGEPMSVHDGRFDINIGYENFFTF
jgi:hypothetical protein